MRRIESPTNPLVKTLRRLAHPRKREVQFLLEGKKLVDAALASSTEVETIVVSSAYRSTPPKDVAVVELDDALTKLTALNERYARIVELRFFGGLEVEEMAGLLGVSSRTIRKDWRVVRAWMARELSGGEAKSTANGE